jgi:hypothetical protein
LKYGRGNNFPLMQPGSLPPCGEVARVRRATIRTKDGAQMKPRRIDFDLDRWLKARGDIHLHKQTGRMQNGVKVVSHVCIDHRQKEVYHTITAHEHRDGRMTVSSDAPEGRRHPYKDRTIRFKYKAAGKWHEYIEHGRCRPGEKVTYYNKKGYAERGRIGKRWFTIKVIGKVHMTPALANALLGLIDEQLAKEDAAKKVTP